MLSSDDVEELPDVAYAPGEWHAGSTASSGVGFIALGRW